MKIDELNRLMLNRMHAGITYVSLRIEDIQDLFQVLRASRDVLSDWESKETISEENLHLLKKATKSLVEWE